MANGTRFQRVLRRLGRCSVPPARRDERNSSAMRDGTWLALLGLLFTALTMHDRTLIFWAALGFSLLAIGFARLENICLEQEKDDRAILFWNGKKAGFKTALDSYDLKDCGVLLALWREGEALKEQKRSRNERLLSDPCWIVLFAGICITVGAPLYGCARQLGKMLTAPFAHSAPAVGGFALMLLLALLALVRWFKLRPRYKCMADAMSCVDLMWAVYILLTKLLNR